MLFIPAQTPLPDTNSNSTPFGSSSLNTRPEKTLQLILGVLKTPSYILKIELPTEIDGCHDILNLHFWILFNLYVCLPELSGQIPYSSVSIVHASRADAVHLAR